jgi:DNA mismatch repair protein MutS
MRALSRLALNRGGPRDLGAHAAGLDAAAAVQASAQRRRPPEEIDARDPRAVGAAGRLSASRRGARPMTCRS